MIIPSVNNFGYSVFGKQLFHIISFEWVLGAEWGVICSLAGTCTPVPQQQDGQAHHCVGHQGAY